MPKFSEEEIQQAMRDYIGYCTTCEKFTRECTEPDAEEYDCPVCEQRTVMGAEQAMMLGKIGIAEAEVEEDDWPVISRYTRAQALEDGMLIDVSTMAKEAGFVYPVAVTQEVWGRYIVPSLKDEDQGQSKDGRLWDALFLLHNEIKRAAGSIDEVRFKVYFTMDGKQKLTDLKALCHPGDDPKPVITIMMPDED